MKKTIILFFILFSITFRSLAQTCGIFLYSDDGRKFKVTANGNAQNPQPMSEVMLCCFPMDIVKIRLEFEDNSTIEKTLYLRAGFVEHHKVTGKKIVFDSYEEMEPQYQNMTTVTVVNINGGSGSIGGGARHGGNGSATITRTTTTNNCAFPMSDRSFYDFYGALKNRSFDSDKLTDAKNAVKRDCFTSKQVKNTLAVFSYESSRLEFAKFAYGYVHDKGAYPVVKEGFSNSLSGNELDEYINKQ